METIHKFYASILVFVFLTAIPFSIGGVLGWQAADARHNGIVIQQESVSGIIGRYVPSELLGLGVIVSFGCACYYFGKGKGEKQA